MFGALIFDGTDHLRAMWFNQPFIKDEVKRGQRLLLTGKVSKRGLRPEMTHPSIDYLDPDEAPPQSHLMPVYSLTEGLYQVRCDVSPRV